MAVTTSNHQTLWLLLCLTNITLELNNEIVITILASNRWHYKGKMSINYGVITNLSLKHLMGK